jgi:signal transduction histidine kinase
VPERRDRDAAGADLTVIPVPGALDEQALRRLLDAGRALVGHLELDAVLERLLETAAEVTGARYAALGILDPSREGLERFLTHGVTAEVRAAIGAPPRGRGVLGALITDPRPLRLDSVREDPRASGFPLGHPPMETFLGVPVLVGEVAWGNLYLTDKAGGEPFTQADEDAVVALAAWAGVAIANARLFADSERRRAELEATTAIALAVGGETELGEVLALIVSHARELLGARGAAILLRDEAGLAVAAESGELPEAVHGARVRGDAARVRASLGLPAADGLLVPLTFRGRSLGMLAVCGAGVRDERLLRSFAASAATAVANARSVEEQRLRAAMAAAEAERGRWARELHDETLQGLGALRLLLVAARRGDDTRLRAGVGQAIERLQGEIDALRGLVRELRPAALDELGLGPAIEGLAERAGRHDGVAVEIDVGLPRRPPADVETAIYRIVQEALNNAVRHAQARHVHVAVRAEPGALRVDVTDDGGGFDPAASTDGFGLAGMRERVALLGGELAVESSPAGTHVAAVLPA